MTAIRPRRMLTMISPRGAVFLLLAVLLVGITVLNPNFAEPGQFIRFIQRVAPIAIVAIGQYFVIVSGEFDLSMGSLITAQVVIAGNLIGADASKSVSGADLHGAVRGAGRPGQRARHHPAEGAVIHRHARHDACTARRRAVLDRRSGDRQPG
jgi:hypothetical protein